LHSRYLVLAAAAACASSLAQQPVTQVVEVTGSSSNYNARRDDTASKTVVGREELARYGDTNLIDSLKRVPGVTVSGGNPQLRGLGDGYTQILLNGERAPAGFSLDGLSPDAVERVEIVRSATADASTRAIAGTINIILKRAVSKAQREWKAGFGKSSGMSEGKASLNLSDRDGKFSYSLAVTASRNTFRRPVTVTEWGRDAAGNTLYQDALHGGDVGNFNALNLTPRLNWELANGDTLSWQSFVHINRLHYDSPYRTEYLGGTARIDPLTDSVTFSTRRNLRTDLVWTRKLEGSAKLETRIGFDAANYATELDQLSRAATGALTLDRFVDGLARDRTVRSSGKYNGRSGAEHALGFGWEASAGRSNNDRNQADFGVAAAPERYLARVNALALYAQDEWTISPRWSAYLGARWEGVDIDLSGTGASFIDSGNRSSVWSPILHTLYKLPGTSGDQVRLALARTYKAPEIARLIPRRTLTINNSASNPDSIGNPALRPELALGIDAAYEHHWSKDALFLVAASARRIDDCTVQALSLEDGRYLQHPENAGHCTVRTLEVETRFPLQTVVPAAPALDVRLSVSRNWSRVATVPGPDNRLAAQVPLSANAGVDYTRGKLTTGAAFVFSKGGHVRLSDTESMTTSSRRDLELYALWKLDSTTQLRMTAWNFLQQDFETDRTYTSVSGSQNTHSVQPGKPWVRLMVESRF